MKVARLINCRRTRCSESLQNDQRFVRYNRFDGVAAAASDYSLYRPTKPVSLCFKASLGALRTPVSEVIAASTTDQSRARADLRGELLEDLEPPSPRPAPRARVRRPEPCERTAAKVARERCGLRAWPNVRAGRSSSVVGCVTLLKYFW
ncbi:unnamed protein product [Euphydryas editha]|uniref:Uncharacterized protein n=1 Tax=Euphydryas editha TaxID=104508 RepID=A0AAU9TLL8_EUPED|nr:unnamed protein product [Euphydryas editha]